MVGLAFCFQQLLTTDLAFRVELPNPAFLGIGQARLHGAGGNKHGGQMPEGQRANRQPRHNLVTHPQCQNAVKHIVRQGHSGRHGNGIAAEQGQFHTFPPLRNTVTHSRHTTGKLGNRPQFTGSLFDLIGIGLEGLVGREHVVVGRHDSKVCSPVDCQRRFVVDV